MTLINSQAGEGKCYRICYLDGGIEDLSKSEVAQAKNEVSISIGEVGFRFMKN